MLRKISSLDYGKFHNQIHQIITKFLFIQWHNLYNLIVFIKSRDKSGVK